jgi:hypothetical protein
MKKLLFGLLASVILLTSAVGQDPIPPPKPREAKRSTVILKHADAKALAETLTKHFKGDGNVVVLAEPKTNTLLISSSSAVHGEVLKLTADLDRKPRMLAVEVIIVDLNTKKGDEASKVDRVGFRGPSAEVNKRIEEMRKKGVITNARRFSLKTLENEPGNVTTGESKPMTAGVAGAPAGAGRGATTRSVIYRDVGTTVDVTVRLPSEKDAQIVFLLRDARMPPVEGGVVLGKDENGSPIYATEFHNTTVKTKLTAPIGHAVLAQGTEGESASSTAQTLVIVTTRVVEAKND